MLVIRYNLKGRNENGWARVKHNAPQEKASLGAAGLANTLARARMGTRLEEGVSIYIGHVIIVLLGFRRPCCEALYSGGAVHDRPTK